VDFDVEEEEEEEEDVVLVDVLLVVVTEGALVGEGNVMTPGPVLGRINVATSCV
jgi:hypothetical protein